MLGLLRFSALTITLTLGIGWASGCGEEDPLLAPPPPGTLEEMRAADGDYPSGPAPANPDIKPVPVTP